jgi:hypothetical protein
MRRVLERVNNEFQNVYFLRLAAGAEHVCFQVSRRQGCWVTRGQQMTQVGPIFHQRRASRALSNQSCLLGTEN